MGLTSTVRSFAPVRPRVVTSTLPVARLEWCLLAALVVGTPLLYLPVVLHNLPVAGNVDERNALEVLRRFHHGSLNPQFFQYPTLYFYLVYVIALPLRTSSVNMMIVGRTFDFALVGLTAFLVYIFCRDRLHSRGAGLIGATFVLGSAVLSEVAGYLHPDLLMTAAGTASLYYLVGYFEHRSLRAWVPGIVLMGIAIGCKYTAFLLYIAYFVTEALYSLHERRKLPLDRGADARFSRQLCLWMLLTAGCILLLSSVFFPIQHILALVANTRSNVEVRPSEYYLDFFRHIRRTLEELGALCFALALLCRLSRNVYAAISTKRLYGALGIVALMSVLCSPMSLVHPKQFLFDLGALTRSNIVVVNGHAQWGAYTYWLLHDEGAVAIALGVIGILLLATRANRRLAVVGVYLAISLLALGSSQLGFFRYLAPIVPLLYCGAGMVIVWIWRSSAGDIRAKPTRRWGRVLAPLLLAGASVQMMFNVVQTRRLAYTTDSYYSSYQVAKEATRGTAYYAGYTPSIELDEAGVRTRQMSWLSISSKPLGQDLSCGDTMILNTRQAADHGIDATQDSSVNLLANVPGAGDRAQQVLRKSGCP